MIDNIQWTYSRLTGKVKIHMGDFGVYQDLRSSFHFLWSFCRSHCGEWRVQPFIWLLTSSSAQPILRAGSVMGRPGRRLWSKPYVKLCNVNMRAPLGVATVTSHRSEVSTP